MDEALFVPSQSDGKTIKYIDLSSMHLSIYIYVSLYVYICTYLPTYVFIYHVCMYVLSIYLYMYRYINDRYDICMCIHMYQLTYLCTYISCIYLSIIYPSSICHLTQ